MTPRLRTSLRFALLSLLALFAGPAFAQGETCSASLLNRTATVSEDGAFSFSGVPSEDGFFRTRVACEGPDGTRRGQSALLEMQPNGTVVLSGIDFSERQPIPVSLEVQVSPSTLTEVARAW